MKGIILAGGYGSRLYPTTIGTCKQLLPIFDKPLIYYSLTTLMECNINDIILITSKEYQKNFMEVFGDGSKLGIKISYLVQDKPLGIAHAFILSEHLIKNHSVCLILGDNIFYGYNFKDKIIQNKGGVKIFTSDVPDPERYGVLNLEKNFVKSIIEKPLNPRSSKAITGIYFFDKQVVQIAKKIKPSKRNELEITDILKTYLKIKKLYHYHLGNGSVWLDAGTPTSLLQASQFVQTIQERQKIQIGSPEQISLKNNWISKNNLKQYLIDKPLNSYYFFLKKLI